MTRFLWAQDSIRFLQVTCCDVSVKAELFCQEKHGVLIVPVEKPVCIERMSRGVGGVDGVSVCVDGKVLKRFE